MAESAIRRRRQAGSVRGLVLVLLVLLGTGAWNYHRSYRADLENHRSLPFASYSTPDLVSLQAGYSEELERSQALYARRRAALGERPDAGVHGPGLADRVAALERTQASARGIREARADFAQNEARLREVEAELERRSRPGAELRLHLERLVRRDHSG